MYKYEITYRYDLDTTYTVEVLTLPSDDPNMVSFLLTNKERLEEIDSYGTIILVQRFNADDVRYQVSMEQLLYKDEIKQAQQESFKKELINEYYQLKGDNPYMNEDWIRDKLVHIWDSRYKLNMKEAICLLKWVLKHVK